MKASIARTKLFSTVEVAGAGALPELNLDEQLDWIWGSDLENEEEEDETPHFYAWREVFPELQLLVDNAQVILNEALAMVHKLRYTPWPESNLYNREDQNGDWKVVPLLYTFPAWDETQMQWVGPNCEQCPETARLLRQLPSVRTALFSRMGPRTRLSSHRGWADLANHVLRCHLALRVPHTTGRCGVWVEGHMELHQEGAIIVFDDSHSHKAFNTSATEDRIILLFDLMRPEGVPFGVAYQGHTDALDGFVESFQQGLSDLAAM